MRSPAVARKLAAHCFALARSTTFPGERASAIARGLAIVEKHGFDIDDFVDAPASTAHGARRPVDSRFADPDFQAADGGFDWTRYQDDLEAQVRASGAPRVPRDAAPQSYTAADVREIRQTFHANQRDPSGVAAAMEQLYATLRRRAEEVGAQDGETVYDARRRNFDDATGSRRSAESNH